jgi:hypothetical protein
MTTDSSFILGFLSTVFACLVAVSVYYGVKKANVPTLGSFIRSWGHDSSESNPVLRVDKTRIGVALAGLIVGNFIFQLIFPPEPQWNLAADRSFFQIIAVVTVMWVTREKR